MKRKISIWQALALGYIIVILAGAGLLTLPFATENGETTFINALFTSTSATCVTGLVAYDSGTHWSLFGQIVILLLIQIGGLGFVTIITVMLSLIGKKLTMAQKITLSETTNFNDYSNIKDLVRGIVITTFAIEIIGACILATRFIPYFGAKKGIYFSIWHAVSAFCNAGFDVLGGSNGIAEFSSLSAFIYEPVVLLTISALVSVGGIGFFVLRDLFLNKFNFKKLQLHTKITITVNTTLIIVSTALFLLFERNHTNAGYDFGTQLVLAIFNSVSPRTAGFNVIDLTKISNSSYILNIVLMFIGGSSGSTAGGIKVGTFALVLFGMRATFTGRKDITVFKKRIASHQVSTALTILVSYLMLLVASATAICAIEANTISADGVNFLSVKEILFECTSALGTVGYSLSTTPLLSTASKIIIIFLMYIGRVGVITVGLAIAKARKQQNVKYPLDNVFIG